MGRRRPQREPRRARPTFWALALAALLLPATAAEANFVYWTNQDGTSIGRAKLNGTGVDDNFIAGLTQPKGIATDSRYIYWMQGGASDATIGRANLDGSGVNTSFIPHQAGMEAGGGLAITPSHGIYWANATNTIGHANLDGTNADPDFITGPSASNCGLATDADFVYWLNGGPSRLNRAALGGGSQIVDFVPDTDSSCGLGTFKGFIYYGAESGRVGRVDASGGLPAEPDFVTASPGPDPLCGMGVTSQFLFWGNPGAATIGRANLNGKQVKSGLIEGASSPCMVTAAPANKVTVTSVRLNQKKGTAWIDAKVPSPGRVELTTVPLGATVASGTVAQVGLSLEDAVAFPLPVTARGGTSKRLNKKGKAWITVYLNFTPKGVNGVPSSEPQTLKLVKKLKRKKKRKKKPVTVFDGGR